MGAVGASRVIDRALDSDLEDIMTSRPNHVVAVGKAAAAMTAAFLKVAHLGAEARQRHGPIVTPRSST